MTRRPPHPAPLAAALAAHLALSACSVKSVAVNALGNALAEGGGTYASDEDPELVAAALPFGLKTIESLLAESPRHPGLLFAAVSGFVPYAVAFVKDEADYVEARDLARATELRARAKKLHRRALGYGLRGLDVAHPGFSDLLHKDAAAAVAKATKADVPVLYWTSAAWASAIAMSADDAELTADQGLVSAMMARALELDESWGGGALHELLVAWDGGRPAAAGGSVDRARKHFERALVLGRGTRAAPLVTWAETISVKAQDRKEFTDRLNQALAVDPDAAPESRVANLVAQKRARWLLARAGDLFVE